MKKPEILAPAGTFKALEGAVKAGADAVYVGGSSFSARAFAGNFDKEELIRAIDYCHFFNAKLYLALNTLLKEEEIARLAGYIEPFYKEGLDGVIVQDVGVCRVISGEFPELALHASTQMSISSVYGAAFLKSLGFTRVVPARELSLEEIREIKNSVDIELETFVHGAMCYCYSGKCLMSSYLGGRSGNRGRCAQPCRRKYEYNGKSEYIMSLKDMCTLEALPELTEAGIDSFKIEGRMKKPEYVAGTVRAYRRALDSYTDSSFSAGDIRKDIDDMRDIYNRGGFSQGYYYQERAESMLASKRPNHTGLKVGAVKKVVPPLIHITLLRDVNEQDVLEIRPAQVELTSAAAGRANETLKINGNNFKKIKPGMEVYRTRNNKLIGEIQKDILDKEIYIEARSVVKAMTGEALEIEIYDDTAHAKVCGSIVQEAKSRSTSAQSVIEKMKKTTGTGVRLEIRCEIDENAFIPMSELNELRRKALEEFKKQRAEKYCRK